MKKFLITAICLTFFFVGLVGCGGAKEPDATDEYFAYTLQEDGTYSIAAKDKSNLPERVEIPATFQGRKVTAITTEGFRGCQGIRELILSPNIKALNSGFVYCKNLKYAEIPQSVKSMGGGFGECTALSRIKYEGTQDEWENIAKSGSWAAFVSDCTIECTDGNLWVGE